MVGSPSEQEHNADPSPGLVVAGRYRLDRLVGEGGMGSVWAATHMVTRRQVALKFLRCAGDSEESRRRFVREARVACAIMHPNVVQVLDFIESDDEVQTMVLELLDGETLATRLKRAGRLSVADTSVIMLPVVSAVGTAHAKGIVHRDLKPDNIFLQTDSEGATLVKVLDFGVAKVTNVDGEARSTAGLTDTGALLGTPLYMSPEQVFGETDLDHRADIWALGIIIYQCLTGSPPTDAANVGQVFKLIVAGTFKPVRVVCPDLPEELAAMIDRMLSRKRENRPDDLRPVQALLERYAGRSAPAFDAPSSAPRQRAGQASEVGYDGDAAEARSGEDSSGTLVLPQEERSGVELGSAPGQDLAKSNTRPRARRWLALAAAVLLAVSILTFAAIQALMPPIAVQPERQRAETTQLLTADAPADSPAQSARQASSALAPTSASAVYAAITAPPASSGSRAAGRPEHSSSGASARRLPAGAGSRAALPANPEDPYGF